MALELLKTFLSTLGCVRNCAPCDGVASRFSLILVSEGSVTRSVRSPLTENEFRPPSLEILAVIASLMVTWIASRSNVDDIREAAAAGSGADWAATGTSGVSSTGPNSVLTRSNISVVLDFLPSCMPLPFCAVNLRRSAYLLWQNGGRESRILGFVLLRLVRIERFGDGRSYGWGVCRVYRRPAHAAAAAATAPPRLLALHL